MQVTATLQVSSFVHRQRESARIRSSLGETCAISVAYALELLRSSVSTGNAFSQAVALLFNSAVFKTRNVVP